MFTKSMEHKSVMTKGSNTILDECVAKDMLMYVQTYMEISVQK